MLTIVILSLFLVVSSAANIFLIWFGWKSLRQIAEYDEELRDLIQIIKSFSTHVESVYEMEMFYGDETLRSLLEHTKGVGEYLLRYENVYSFTQPDLMEQLEQASRDLENEYQETEEKKEE